jgi:hypothetical protein
MGATRREAFLFSSCLGALALAGCGGGGGGSSAAVPAVIQQPTGGGSSAPASLTFTIVIPSAGASSALRSPRYISAGTKSAVISIGGNKQTVNCAGTCSATLQVSPGTATIVASLYAGADGTGSVLATGTTTATIVGGQSNSVSVAFGGVVASLNVSLGATSVNSGASTQTPVAVKAMDAAGYTIIGPEAYANPIVLGLDDHSGATGLSTTSLTSPNSSAVVTYNGSASISSVHVSASVPGTSVTAQTATLSIAAPPPLGGGTFPDHVRTMAYYGLNGINADIPASYMAAHVDIVEDDGYTAPHADAFKRAGGKMAFAYTDATYAAHCPPPFTPPAGACGGQTANLVPNDESAYVHDSTGARVHRFVSDYFQYQEVFNPNSAAAQHAYAQMTASILKASPLIDAFEADDSGSAFSRSGHGIGSELYLGFNTTGVEVATDAQWIAGHTAMLAAAGKPLMVNGGDPDTLGVAYGGAFIDQPFVMGQQFEGCFNNSGPYLYTDNDSQFQRESNGLLEVYAHHKSAMCFPSGDTVPEHRLYGYAAWLQTYDPVYSIYQMELPQSDGESLYPETQLVPTQPRSTPTTISQNKIGAVYVREFAACAIAGVGIGPCASVVNSSPTASAAIPSLSISYSQQITLDAQSLYHGGKAHVVAGAPATLAPATAAILVR